MQIHEQILKNYEQFDSFLNNISLNNECYKTYLSIRLLYSAINGKKTNVSKKESFIDILKTLYALLKIFRIKAILKTKNEVVVIGSHKLDYQVAEELKIDNVNIIFFKQKISITKKNFQLVKIFFKCMKLYFKNGGLKFSILLKSLPGMIDFLIASRDIDVSGIKVFIMESDSMPLDLALIFKAKEYNIDTIKIDHFLIDPINHNRIFCDHYFYPSFLHLSIMQKFPENNYINYVKGGIIHWDKLGNYPLIQTECREITFFGQHGEILNERDELFYINEILSLMNENDILNIKIHPNDKTKKFNYYKNYSNVSLIEDIKDNNSLIARSAICFSICSTMSLEAKHICENSYFINYEIEKFNGYVDYITFENSIETIYTRKDLKKVLLHNKKTLPISNFIANFNFNFPHSTKAIQNFISKVIDEKNNL